nr:MAG TPA: hypothetical protein [Caudoviricetes sp.]
MTPHANSRDGRSGGSTPPSGAGSKHPLENRRKEKRRREP